MSATAASAGDASAPLAESAASTSSQIQIPPADISKKASSKTGTSELLNIMPSSSSPKSSWMTLSTNAEFASSKETLMLLWAQPLHTSTPPQSVSYSGTSIAILSLLGS
ncbi:hypothetical protein VE03_04421 [Pseudogymnoascus sp. 23342-1-I1]|nr:hypothetical protein VE03_04421 [Pseudogymnoascus sp. 23342-1-I1]